MKKYLDIDSWNRKELYEHFRTLVDPTFAVVVDVDVTIAYNLVKKTDTSFFVKYLHACMKAINAIENFKYRIEDDKIAIQVKRQQSNVSRRAVSDAVAGMNYYDCNKSMVITNSYYSKAAYELATVNYCELVDRDELVQWIIRFQAEDSEE